MSLVVDAVAGARRLAMTSPSGSECNHAQHDIQPPRVFVDGEVLASSTLPLPTRRHCSAKVEKRWRERRREEEEEEGKESLPTCGSHTLSRLYTVNDAMSDNRHQTTKEVICSVFREEGRIPVFRVEDVIHANARDEEVKWTYSFSSLPLAQVKLPRSLKPTRPAHLCPNSIHSLEL